MERTRYELLKMGTDYQQKKEFKYENEEFDKSDCFVIDLEGNNEPNTTTSNQRITLARKIPQRGIERNIDDKDSLAPSSSPRDTQVTSTPEKSLHLPTSPMGSQETTVNNKLPQHQITIKTGGMSPVPEGRWGRRPSFKRSPSSWFNHPKRILLFFATLSSMGTMMLIFFTLSMSKRNETEGISDWQ